MGTHASTFGRVNEGQLRSIRTLEGTYRFVAEIADGATEKRFYKWQASAQPDVPITTAIGRKVPLYADFYTVL